MQRWLSYADFSIYSLLPSSDFTANLIIFSRRLLCKQATQWMGNIFCLLATHFRYGTTTSNPNQADILNWRRLCGNKFYRTVDGAKTLSHKITEKRGSWYLCCHGRLHDPENWRFQIKSDLGRVRYCFWLCLVGLWTAATGSIGSCTISFASSTSLARGSPN